MNILIHRYDNMDIDNITYGSYSKEEENIVVPLLMNNRQLFIQISNLLISSLDNDVLTLKINDSNKSHILLSSIEEKTISNLKEIIKKIKPVNTKFSYDSCIDDEIICIPMDLYSAEKNKLKIFMDKKNVSLNEFINCHCRDGTSIDIIVECYVNICDNTIKSVFLPHQIKINETKRIRYTLDEYSFVESPEFNDAVIPVNLRNSDEYNNLNKSLSTNSVQTISLDHILKQYNNINNPNNYQNHANINDDGDIYESERSNKSSGENSESDSDNSQIESDDDQEDDDQEDDDQNDEEELDDMEELEDSDKYIPDSVELTTEEELRNYFSAMRS
ncbi:MAG: hypothetical protein Terrestrivirus4_204 [Terrestrivirus sp.]|uniref:Uncharacterized protein n=1 Tax=Terrestrivirus sp. TaxID=2487775 RepID=A0A3G4ZMT3_9VIRU|nr:MAG: hypothetical protein Terrestrivirus4_204 [Terrestrivirus sp.]